MINWKSLNNNNFNDFKHIYSFNRKFNSLNKDFFEVYSNHNFIKRYLMRKKVKLFQSDSKYLGYIWVDSFDKNDCIINSMNFVSAVCIDRMDLSINQLFEDDTNITYTCEESEYSNKILNNLGFTMKSGVYELNRYLNDLNVCDYNCDSEISFHKLINGRDEKIRCKIQNQIFGSNSRINLTEEDIIIDELQEYYIEGGAVFIKKQSEYIGYGQIIKEKDTAVIVNFGILKEYRGEGYSKYLLNYLLNHTVELGFKKVKLNVDHENHTAINLYKSFGFKSKNKILTWELKNEH